MKYQFNDGGRAAAGYKGETRDCVTRSIAIATEQPYQQVYDDLQRLCKAQYTPKFMGKNSPRTGIAKDIVRSYLTRMGWTWVPTMQIGSGCTVHLRADELPTGRIIVSVSRHLCAVIDGVLNDTFDCTRAGSRCVYGYYKKEAV